MVVMTVAVMMVCLSSHINDSCRTCQHWRILILNELGDAFTDDPEEQNEPDDYEYFHSLFSLRKITKGLRYYGGPSGLIPYSD